MSIIAKNITKLYGAQKALDNVSFEIKSGEIVGFLGPNGAGKSTMMKILTCFLPPTSGEAFVCGFDIYENELEIKKRIGYLAETNPLYNEMYVKEFLSFCAGIHNMKNKSKDAVSRMINLTGLEREQHKKIGALSKGYKQRVGIAQALIHDPQVLILDEPTSGLDPNQIVQIRDLIKSISAKKTIMLSTHIMREVEVLCDRVIIINKGSIVSDKSIHELQHTINTKNYTVLVEFDKKVEKKLLLDLPHVKNVTKKEGETWELLVESEEDIRPQIFKFAVKHDVSVISLKKEEHSLEEVFQLLTKK